MTIIKKTSILILLIILSLQTYSQIVLGYKNNGILVELYKNRYGDTIYNGCHFSLLNNTRFDRKINGISLSLASYSSGDYYKTNGIVVDLFNFSCHKTNGINIGILKSYLSEFENSIEKGFNFSVINYCNSKNIGLNISAINIGHLGNAGGPILKGLSLSAFNLFTESHSGLTISLINFSSSSKGVQIGLLNSNWWAKKNLQIGLINICNRAFNFNNQIGIINICRMENSSARQFGIINIGSKFFKVLPFYNYSKKEVKTNIP